MTKYILLTPLTPEAFTIETHDELLEAVNEFGCDLLVSHFPDGNTCSFATANNKDVLIRMCETVELPGIVLEYTAVYDQAEILL
jgi:hypothetical protein